MSYFVFGVPDGKVDTSMSKSATPDHYKTKNTVFIGDNLPCLEILAHNHTSFDVIYIDPPYNTGNKLSYDDKRTPDAWIDFMSKRLELAKAVLKSDGVIFISIDDNSLYELKLTCDGIFGRDNFLGVFITKQAIRSNARHINTVHEYVVGYAQNKKKLGAFRIKRMDNPSDALMIKDISNRVKREFINAGRESAEQLLAKLNAEYMSKKDITWLRNYSMIDDKGDIFFPKDLSVPGQPAGLTIDEINLRLPALKTRRWSSSEKIIKLYKENKLHFKGDRPYEMHYLKDATDNVLSILDFYSRQGTNDLDKLGLRGLFDTPKPVELIKYLIRIATNGKDSALILDFFAGSGTLGQAVMEINIEDKKNHHFYLVQLDEKIARHTKQYEFAKQNNLTPTADQLMIHRLHIAKEKLGFDKGFDIVKVRSV